MKYVRNAAFALSQLDGRVPFCVWLTAADRLPESCCYPRKKETKYSTCHGQTLLYFWCCWRARTTAQPPHQAKVSDKARVPVCQLELRRKQLMWVVVQSLWFLCCVAGCCLAVTDLNSGVIRQGHSIWTWGTCSTNWAPRAPLWLAVSKYVIIDVDR